MSVSAVSNCAGTQNHFSASAGYPADMQQAIQSVASRLGVTELDVVSAISNGQTLASIAAAGRLPAGAGAPPSASPPGTGPLQPGFSLLA